MKYVYHSSKTQGIKTIKPKSSTHNIEWVYAMKKPEYSLMFLGNNNDLINQISFLDGTPVITERFRDSLRFAYQGTKGSIYKLSGSNFKENITSFLEEVICEKSCDVITEEKIEDALVEILELEQAGKIQIYHYPDLPSWIPKDKSDLVEKINGWISIKGKSYLSIVEKFHPEILEQINE